MRRWFWVSAGVMSLGAAHTACGSDADPAVTSSGGGGQVAGAAGAAGTAAGGTSAGGAGGTTGGSGGGGNAAGSGGSSGSATGGAGAGPTDAGADVADADYSDVQFVYDAPADSGQDACAETTVTTQLKPLDMYVMFDRSGTMSEPGFPWYSPASDCNVGDPIVNSRWCRAVNGLGQYFTLPASANNRAALQYFPRPGVTTCPGTGYGTPAVGLTQLPSPAGGPLITSLNQAAPEGTYTPTHDAILGLNAFTAANQDPNRQMISVLITDGLPNSCPVNGPAGLAQILGQHHANTGIPTYVIGVTGVDFAALEVIAQGGGTTPHPDNIGALTDTCGNGPGPCHHWNVGQGDPNVVAEALKAIQQQAVGCTLDIPIPSQGVPDWSQVQVQYSPGGNPPPVTLPRVSFASQCSGPGWYYDNNQTPTKVNLCPGSCTTVQADPAAQVALLLGCLGA